MTCGIEIFDAPIARGTVCVTIVVKSIVCREVN